MTKECLIHHIALKVADLANLELFYTKILGLKVIKRQLAGKELRSVWFGCGPVVLMLEQATEGKKAGKGWHLVALQIDVSERLTWKKRLLDAGVMVTHETSYSLYFDDPEGNHLALSHYPKMLAAGDGNH